ncbi:hypothetical protein VW35_19690 [Devosia soli]|uniref:Uncharacterized protein n=1 Tax=Devosia soli TaxID=361041 RepID=A0A0F5L0Q8_9HYPH|nr:hypothetical protein [Devosia soli]KKB75963.1 hypothetical protein VW35_19690 [Devosia soli]
MPIRMHHIAREVGAAFAVLAIYMLVLLAPLHQVSGLQKDLARLGFESTSSFSVCTSVSDDRQDETPLAAKCPLTGVAKFELAAVSVESNFDAPLLTAINVVYGTERADVPAAPSAHPGIPRAPPALA